MLFGKLAGYNKSDIHPSTELMPLPDNYKPKFYGEIYISFNNAQYKIVRTLSSVKL